MLNGDPKKIDLSGIQKEDAKDAERLKTIIAKLSPDQSLVVLKEVAAEIAKRFHQELVGENEDLLDRVVRKYRANVVRRTIKVAQKWCKWSNNGPILLPNNARLYYRRGQTEVIVMELPPQIRLMKIKGILSQRPASTPAVPDELKLEYDKVYNYSLALPYMVFMFKFENGLFVDCYLAFNDRPLKNLKERPLRPYLSNIDNTLRVCHGVHLDKSQFEKDNLTQQVAFVMGHFWQTVYSDEWSANYWDSKTHFQQISDQRLATIDNWQEASSENPLFVIEDANWLKHTEANFGDMLVRMFEQDKESLQFQEELYNDLIEGFLNEVKSTLEANVKAVKTKIETIPNDQMATRLWKSLEKLK